MPEEAYWASFFDPDRALAALGCSSKQFHAVEFGCGYGTFTVAAARIVTGTGFALDIDPEMVEITSQRGMSNVRATLRDFVLEGTGLEDGSCDYAMIFNLLHLERPVDLLREAHRVLAPGGTLGIMHWKYDASTPRGPSMDIRPKPEHCIAWALQAGFETGPAFDLEGCPYHYGIVARKRHG